MGKTLFIDSVKYTVVTQPIYDQWLKGQRATVSTENGGSVVVKVGQEPWRFWTDEDRENPPAAR